MEPDIRLRDQAYYENTYCFVGGDKKKALLGQGGYAEVYQIMLKSELNHSNPQYFAAKYMWNVPNGMFLEEYKIMLMVNHKNIVRVIDAVEMMENNRKTFILILEYCKHASLEDLIKSK